MKKEIICKFVMVCHFESGGICDALCETNANVMGKKTSKLFLSKDFVCSV